MNDELTSKRICLVTGASTGIGHAVAHDLAEHGFEVLAAVRRPADMTRLLEVRSGLQPILLDLTDDAAIAAAAAEVAAGSAKSVSLVHCAGVYANSPWQDAEIEELDLLYRTNVRGPYLLTRKLLPELIRSKGSVVFINSSSGIRARPGLGAFSATQHALRAMADSLRDEVNEAGVRVVSIYPGRTATKRMETLFAAEKKTYQPELLLQPEDVARLVRSSLTQPSHVELTDLHIRPSRKTY